MSLLGEIHGSAEAPPGGVAGSLRRLCTALLAENRLPAAAVVAARIRLPAGDPVPVAVPRELGWSGIPIFWEAPAGDGEVEVIAHVRLKRRRKLKTVALDSATKDAGSPSAATRVDEPARRDAAEPTAADPHQADAIAQAATPVAGMRADRGEATP
ncbi:MAG TPA: hypothetical protein VGD74_10240 [Vulgatibacter sp.]